MYVCTFQNELKNIEDACDELMLADSDESIPFFMGEAFIYHGMEKTQVQYSSVVCTSWLYLHITPSSSNQAIENQWTSWCRSP